MNVDKALKFLAYSLCPLNPRPGARPQGASICQHVRALGRKRKSFWALLSSEAWSPPPAQSRYEKPPEFEKILRALLVSTRQLFLWPIVMSNSTEAGRAFQNYICKRRDNGGHGEEEWGSEPVMTAEGRGGRERNKNWKFFSCFVLSCC